MVLSAYCLFSKMFFLKNEYSTETNISCDELAITLNYFI